ncbi:MAG: RNA polymerase subunit sigma [Stygiobacter sp. RIFOXYC12_FULL_38_8]|nr:MAG: RNA polymerase sigma factor RpoE [Stygiobacter sp.]KAF0214738.1 MAG: RNA polymerase sigma factor [Ignavibacteria bacterium]OGU64657.1 MAG: RNA polymerase subunit sigma [Stygiobacter sp. GWC2_38_9]OGU85682.1 MAG: RNA polymerase subunit sigma [Stygiobacter sp. RIFOXYA12_FULL_38_9]OGV09790.1 MAG: RNA polymerase subunit sigma [Stygiobacter sp. RIFOXYB2_FULL_37_11]OGV13659.1 MAG: RNA polymerase subunit sigma [Stygiobacter sp. RIFOXYC2_FULL_38_25]OGV24833.1 MAG: RNA polymerase subunit sigma
MSVIEENKTEEELQLLYADFQREAVPHMNAVFNFALRMTGDEDDANDLVQETYLKAFRFFDKFEKGTNCKAWLFRILKNSYINDYRKAVKEPNKVDYEDVQNFYENVKSDEIDSKHYEQDAFSNLLDDEITKVLSALPEDFRTAIILSDIEGFTYEEIADFVDIPVGTVRSRLHRARKMLYAQLYDYAKDKGYVNRKKEKSRK